MAEIAVGLATKQAEGLIDKLHATISGELSLLLRVREEIRFIKDEMKIMSAFLRRAEEKQYKDPVAKAWVEQVKELAYVIEDCIDEFSLHLPCRSSNITLVAALWHRARSVGSLRARRRIAANIQSIKFRVKEVSERRWRYGIDEKATSIDMNVVAQYDPRSSAVFVNKSQLIGIDEPLNKLVGWLLDKNKPGLRLISVVGGAGLGKTTIVKRAYEDQEVAGGYFQCCAWITVSQVYHIEGLLRSMIKQLIPDQKDEDLNKITERTELVQRLRDYLEDKRCTFNSWKLFCERVFPEQQTCPEELKELSKDILDKCDGSPLAIVAIAATLASKPKKTSKEWESFFKLLSSEFETNPNLQGVMKILNYSYTDLSYHVQRCFLYLSRFPEDSVINCKRIKRLWMAEGLISARRDMSAEEVAESYLNMLINRSMILPSKISARGEIKGVMIHDIMMEMIVSLSVEENFVSRIQKDRSWHSQGVIRRLLVDSGRIPDDLSLSYVRSLILFGDSMPLSPFVSPAFKLLRVLDLDGCRYFDEDHLDGLCQLLHLKYLSLRNTRVTAIPKSIGRLGNLETFDMRGCSRIKIPVEIEKLKRLQLLRGDDLRVPTKLKLWKLTALQELGLLRIEDAEGEKQLQNLHHLRKLHVWFESYAKRGGYLLDSLKTMTSSLRSLKVSAVDDLNFLKDQSTLVESPLLRLESLYLKGSLDALPNWVTSLTNLTKLTLIMTKLRADAIEALGTLPNLIQLQLSWGAYKEGRLCFKAESFKSLKLLVLCGMRLRSLVFEIGAMPCLERARLAKIWLRGVGTSSGEDTFQIPGLENLIGLKMIELHLWGGGERAVDSVIQAAKAHPNDPKLIISEGNPFSSSVCIT